jgi:hypothetical protein
MKPLLHCIAVALLAGVWIVAAACDRQSHRIAEDCERGAVLQRQFGLLENELIKEEVLWRIKTLHAYSRFCTPYADGWGKSALANTRPEKSFLPDRPPTVAYEPYAATFAAPFYYKNPVTQR